MQLTDEALIHFWDEGAKHATLIAAQNCKLAMLVLGLWQGVVNISGLNLSYCGGVSNETLIVVAKALKQLELFTARSAWT